MDLKIRRPKIVEQRWLACATQAYMCVHGSSIHAAGEKSVWQERIKKERQCGVKILSLNYIYSYDATLNTSRAMPVFFRTRRLGNGRRIVFHGYK